ncbi:uncharacterized protein JCM10292_002627 [Rhodotorula paludigena]|uniref:uncharacterized protein n=1 Tax=Rhodotorula paludigena TaxID=86838 RepID=UPI0031818CA2
MASQLLAKYKAVHAAALDGSVSYPRFAAEQLVKLYNIISEERRALEDALQKDTGVNSVEAQCELALVLALVKRTLEHVEYERQKERKEAALKDDGRIEKGKGVLLIVSDAAAPLYSVIAPLAMGISTGNAIACFLPSSTPSLSSLLELTLTKTLNRFAYLFTTSDPATFAAPEFVLKPSAPVFVITSRTTSVPESGSTLVASAGTAGATAVVDRLSPSSAELASVARLVVRGKFHALGRLPGSVARVLVHEESAGALLDAILHEIGVAFGRDAALASDYGRMRGGAWEAPDFKREKDQGARVLCGGARKAGDEDGFYPPTVLSNPSCGLLTKSPQGPILPVETFGSHEDLLYKLGGIDTSVLYLFSPEPEVVEYLAAESTATTVYANDIPLEALYDPGNILTSPSHYLSTSRLVRPTASSSTSSPALFAPFTPSRLSALASLFPREQKLVFKRTKHANIIRRVFFLQGVFITLGAIVTVLLGSTGWVGWSAIKWFKSR